MKNLTKEKGSKYYNIEKIKEDLKNSGAYEDQHLKLEIKQSLTKKELSAKQKITKEEINEFINKIISPIFLMNLMKNKNLTLEVACDKIKDLIKEIETEQNNKLKYLHNEKIEILENDQKLKRFLNKLYFFEILKDKIMKEAEESNSKEREGKDKFSHLFTTNKSAAFYLTKETAEDFKDGNLKNRIIEKFNIVGFKSLEIPASYDIKELEEFLSRIIKVMEVLKIEKIETNLRIKKFTKKYAIDAVFNSELNTIALDSRKQMAFFHEVGHCLYEVNNITFISDEDFEKYKNDARLKNYKKMDHYSDIEESEIHAFYFEDLASKILEA